MPSHRLSPELRENLEKRLAQLDQTAIGAHPEVEKPPTCGEEDSRSHLVFPDHSKRFYPAADFPAGEGDESTHLHHFQQWEAYMQGLYGILDSEEWIRAVPSFGIHGQDGWFVVRLPQAGLQPEHWWAAVELAREISDRGMLSRKAHDQAPASSE